MPTSDGPSKLGELKKRMNAVTESEVTIEKRAESVPELMIIVEDSETLMVATFELVELFSAIENEALFVKIGAVVSGV